MQRKLLKAIMEPSVNEGEYTFGKGTVYVIRKDPKEFVMQSGNDSQLVSIVKQLYEQKAKAGILAFKNNFYLGRGAYDLVSVMDESVSKEPYILKGRLIDLFDPQLPVVHVGAVIGFKTTKGEIVHAKVASSFISFEQASLNLKELGNDNFDQVAAKGKAACR